MAIEVKLPELGDGIESGDVLEVFVKLGDIISQGQDIIEMETDKATVPVPASVGGKVTKILVSEGDTVPIGATILEVEEAASGAATRPPATRPPAAHPAPPPESAPEPAQRAQPPAASPPPARPVPPAEPAPRRSAPVPAAASPPAAPASPPPATAASAGPVIPAGPAIRRFAREVGVDLNRVTGSGDHGRITREDVLSVVRSASHTARSAAAAPPATAPEAASAPSSAPAVRAAASGDVDDFGPIRVERMTKIRKTIAAQMHASWSGTPRVTNFDDADITDLESLRQTSKDDYAAQGLKLTTMPFLIKAVATALRHHPVINAVIDPQNEQIIYKDYVNVGIAVDTDRGLVVPVMRNTDRMGIPEITRHLAELAGKVRSGNFAVNELRGGTFTISNLGAIGGLYSTPIINVPEVAILLVGRSRKLPVVMPDDSIRPRLMMPLSISYDHRLVDGGAAARFLNDVIGYLEAPSRLLLAL